MRKSEPIRSIVAAKWHLQYAREACLKGFIDRAIDAVVDIAAFYERAGMSEQALVCSNTFDRLLLVDSLDYHGALDILNDLTLESGAS